VENNYDEALFLKRRTSRLGLKNKLIPQAAIASLSEIAKAWHQDFAVTTDNEQIERLMSHNTKALFEDLNSPDYHDEIIEWFRYSDTESNRKLDGLDYRCMNTAKLT